MSGFSAGGTGVNLGVAQWHEFLTCWLDGVAGELAKTDTAVKAAALVLDRKLAPDDEVIKRLVKGGKALKAFGWLVQLWPAYQLGIGNDVDKIRELLTSGGSAQVNYGMDPRSRPPALDELLLSADGLGPLRMDMTANAAVATKMVVKDRKYCDPEIYGEDVQATHWVPTAAYPPDNEGTPWEVGFRDDGAALWGVEVHSAKVRTTEGVGIGDGLAELRSKYGLGQEAKQPTGSPRGYRVFYVDDGPNSSSSKRRSVPDSRPTGSG